MMLDRVKGWIKDLVDVGLGLAGLAITLQLVFGKQVAFIGTDVIGNITKIVGDLGNAGLVGLVTLGTLIWLVRSRN
jgi:hypothetical protein